MEDPPAVGTPPSDSPLGHKKAALRLSEPSQLRPHRRPTPQPAAMSHPAPIFPAANAGIASSPTSPSPSPDSSPAPPSPKPATPLFSPAADPTSEVDEIDSPAPNTMEVESPSAVLVVPGPGSSTPAALVEPRQAEDTTVLPSSSMVVDPPRSPVPPIPSAEDLFLRRQADLAHREWRVEVKSALSDHPDFASPSFANSFPALWNRGLAAFPLPQDAQEAEWRTKVLKATLPFLLHQSGARAEVRNMDPVAQNLLDHIERAEGDVRDTTAVVTEAVDAVEALAREDTKARGLKGSAVFKFVGDRVAEHEAKIDARTKDLASLGEDLADLSSKIANVTDDLVAAKRVWDDFRHELYETRPYHRPWYRPLTTFDPSAPPVAPKPAPKPQPKTKKTTKAKGKGKAKAAPVSASESPPPRPPSPVPGPSKRPAPTSGEESEPIAIRRPKRSKPAPEALFLPPLSDSDVAIVEAEDLAPASGPSKRATRSQTADKGKKASAVVLKVPAAKTSILPFAKDMVSTMPFYACTRCLRLGLTCKWAPDCKACRGCQNGKVGCEEGASVKPTPPSLLAPSSFCLSWSPGIRPTPRLLFTSRRVPLSWCVPGGAGQHRMVGAYRRGWPRSTVASIRGPYNSGVPWSLRLAGLPVSLPADPGHRLHSYLDRLESEQGRAWLHSIDLPDDSRGEGDVEASGAEAAGESNGDLIDE
ncbi:hypothetical protein HGRIS_003298 [Hohenbuehelia grisea]|uniref:Uncharacterized protein n=1 Tax=Hohenbuehelia grisea TaxID=104357 RepID=A0ABR3JGG1_9AGAR